MCVCVFFVLLTLLSEFSDAWKSRWVNSEHKSDYGQFKLTAGNFYGDAEKDKGKCLHMIRSSLKTATLVQQRNEWWFASLRPPTGLQTSQDARFYATSARFDSFSNEDKSLVIQFTVKHEQKIDCGGGYVKVFPADLNQADMHGDSQYYVMFGTSTKLTSL